MAEHRRKTAKKHKKHKPRSEKKQEARKVSRLEEKTPTTPHPRVIDNPDFLNLLDQELTQEAVAEGEPARGVGRPPGTGKHQQAARDMAAQEIAGLNEQVVCDMWKLPFNLWAAARKIDELKLTDPEAIALARPSLVLLTHYGPEKLSPIHLAWYQLSAVVVTVTMSRLLILRKVQSATQKPGPANKSKGNRPTSPVDTPPQEDEFPKVL